MKHYILEDNSIIESVINKTIVSLSAKCSIINSMAFKANSSLEEVSFPWCNTIGSRAFEDCGNLKTVSFPNCTSIGDQTFHGCTSLSAIYLLTPSVCTLSNSDAFGLTPIANSTYLGYFGSIYVFNDLVETYKAAENWSYYADRIVGYIP